MSEHTAVIRWENDTGALDYDRYSRRHRWEFDGGPVVEASAGAKYRGDDGCVDPEEALVAAASSCHMLTFLAIAARRKLVVSRYEDRAVGYLEKDAEGRLAVTRIELRPAVTFSGTTPASDELSRLHEAAHRNCFIANSIRATVTVTA